MERKKPKRNPLVSKTPVDTDVFTRTPVRTPTGKRGSYTTVTTPVDTDVFPVRKKSPKKPITKKGR